MSRPIKWRTVEFVPENKCFAPCPKGNCDSCSDAKEIQLKIEELEAMRLKDIEGLIQEECAERMQVSRQTFQNIIDEARKKVTMALVEDLPIYVGGGNYTRNPCKFECLKCGKETVVSFEEEVKQCSHCGSENIVCYKHCTKCQKYTHN
ncbi:DUF134 domain-containing protein [Desulfitobacterium metallireducens]|uniref:UPF0251 protein DESME_01670 n=1 Tax=Desulfitobacterium metallireducens DSM 15288 TaxID=871968 RepID=W0E9N1_9FIRM|nr:DUF134 domain-containing protein [Desulfitobacterium metallireducens]AHF05934.1 hypothetical protein DESME_01670 [Desulfitobacterium metallireducens DSM 15288]